MSLPKGPVTRKRFPFDDVINHWSPTFPGSRWSLRIISYQNKCISDQINYEANMSEFGVIIVPANGLSPFDALCTFTQSHVLDRVHMKYIGSVFEWRALGMRLVVITRKGPSALVCPIKTYGLFNLRLPDFTGLNSMCLDNDDNELFDHLSSPKCLTSTGWEIYHAFAFCERK